MSQVFEKHLPLNDATRIICAAREATFSLVLSYWRDYFARLIGIAVDDTNCMCTLTYERYTGDIHDYMSRQLEPMKCTRELIRQVSRPVALLHSIGIVHGDIKIANYVVRNNNGISRSVLLTDFGHSFYGTRASGIHGTPGHMAPEIPDSITRASDMYALGRSIVADMPDPEEDDLIRTITDRCLHRDPERRISSAAFISRLGEPAPYAPGTWFTSRLAALFADSDLDQGHIAWLLSAPWCFPDWESEDEDLAIDMLCWLSQIGEKK